MIKYPHIENVSTLSTTQLYELNNKTYCVTEKVHGANCQYVHDTASNTWEIYSRNNKVDDFYNAKAVLEQDLIKEIAPNIEMALMQNGYVGTKYHFFGEIFGGNYDHPEIPRIMAGAKRVQRGVYYSPRNHWLCFDIGVEENDGFYFIPQSVLFTLSEEFNFPVVPLLGIYETLKQALEYPNNQVSIVYNKYNLPEIKNNIMEGVVIKLWGQDTAFHGQRVVFKNKNEIFAEKAGIQKKNDLKMLSNEFTSVYEIAESYLTSNRIINAMSHIGECTFKDIGSILKEAITDIHTELTNEIPAFIALEKGDQSRICKMLSTKAAKMIKEEIIKNKGL